VRANTRRAGVGLAHRSAIARIEMLILLVAVIAIMAVAAVFALTMFAAPPASQPSGGTQEGIPIGGVATLTVYSPQGRVVQTWQGHNTIAPDAAADIANCLSGEFSNNPPPASGIQGCTGFTSNILILWPASGGATTCPDSPYSEDSCTNLAADVALSPLGCSVSTQLATAPIVGMTPTLDSNGYWLAGSDGIVYPFGDATPYGGLSAKPSSPIVGIAIAPDGKGYWLAGSDGTVYSFGSASLQGDLSSHAPSPVVGIASLPPAVPNSQNPNPATVAQGYWLVDSQGQVFSYGKAAFWGDLTNVKITAAIIGILSSPDGRGYWLIGSDGGLYAFGSARYYGNTNVQVVGGGALPVPGESGPPASGSGTAAPKAATSPTGQGYWLVTAKGVVYGRGDAKFYGDLSSATLSSPIVGLAPTYDGEGYWLVASDGSTYPFGDATAIGGLGGTPCTGWTVTATFPASTFSASSGCATTCIISYVLGLQGTWTGIAGKSLSLGNALDSIVTSVSLQQGDSLEVSIAYTVT
jgi:hypothetical protein